MARPTVLLKKWINIGFTVEMVTALESYKRVYGIISVSESIRLLLSEALSRTTEKDLVEAKELLRMLKYKEVTKENQQDVLDRVDKLLEEST
jgi:demethoxyubiquinone hydroxylase (CLK1/Coq7/Cat5 family)